MSNFLFWLFKTIPRKQLNINLVMHLTSYSFIADNTQYEENKTGIRFYLLHIIFSCTKLAGYRNKNRAAFYKV